MTIETRAAGRAWQSGMALSVARAASINATVLARTACCYRCVSPPLKKMEKQEKKMEI
jgi:hypothetical protein